ncbi:Nuclear factor of activated T-cells, cytoplasmic 2 [Oryzias melastigma]|uniref:Nuclear factor of activated T-cells, cytoplasmic 2 n=1 Tax=Oryzias melastigma TaxID=30732 RepID=A0A3B3C4H1_ORYME|nr:nuclear factor of activated T-cells, cytoplasmic 2 [Oryzias melastigma]KAF6731820.1 Nuclear factor of activated T-cells, cytoplasmic 2 [Oryzias melastigma]
MTSGGLGLREGLGQDINEGELDFSDLFLYTTAGDEFPVGCTKDDPNVAPQNNSHPSLVVVDSHDPYMSASAQPVTSQDTSTYSHNTENLQRAVFDPLGLISRPNTIPAPSPRIEITPSGDSMSSQTLEPSPASKSLGAYRECVSPASSNSSTGWPVDIYSPITSPCVTPPHAGSDVASLPALDLCPVMQNIHTSSMPPSPGTSPRNSVTDETFLQPHHPGTASPLPHRRSRSTSPQGKRSLQQAGSCQEGTPVKQRSRSPSPIPVPHEHQYQHYLHQNQVQTEFQPQAQTTVQGLEEVLSSLSSSLPRSIPPAMVRGAHAQAQRQDRAYGEPYDWTFEQETACRAGPEVKSETIYMLPAMWPQTQQVHHTARSTFSGFSVTPLPSLEWTLPSQSGQYELLIQQQPRSHHRAHYETEGSRGAVKTPSGGHPEIQLLGYQGTTPLGLQVFIGTADERVLKPHAFYQVHRITGKTVTTPSLETMINGTKVLEIPLEPQNHMRVLIDCVGILKLRNADIELRNGETDIGRKNTRVRLVFRVHIPQHGGQLVSLQVASNPIECSQRSAQELPAVERQDLDRCSVLGGQQMVLTGQNFTSDSKVIFSEKTQDGLQIWEVEATVDRDKTQANMLFVEIPPYRDRTICQPAKVNFYVINGKKKRSQPQHFIYTPVIAIKSEPLDDYHLNSYSYSDNPPRSTMSMRSLYHHLEQDINPQALTLYHLATVDPRAQIVTTDPLEEPAYYQSRGGSLLSSPLIYHTPNQHYTNCSPAVLSHSAPSSSQCVSVRTPVAKLSEVPKVCDPLEACYMSRQQGYVQTSLPLGKSPPSKYAQMKAGGGAESAGHHVVQIKSARENCDVERAPERVKVKQENLSYAYLEDVNDIIRRDMKGHNGE